VGRGMRADAGGIQGPPLAAGAEDEEDGVHGLAVGDPGVVAARRMGRAWGEGRGDPVPQEVGDAPSVVVDGVADGIGMARALAMIGPPGAVTSSKRVYGYGLLG
jgi:hypothetical protein